jgi:DNA processing protein
MDASQWIRLSILAQRLSRPLVPAIERLGGPEAFLDASPPEREEALDGLSGPARTVVEGVLACSVDAETRSLAGCGGRAVSYWDSAYPSGLRDLERPPVCLFLLGSVEALARRSVAIVGSRQSHSYGLEVARELAAGMAKAGCTVVSGLALGIDTAAHRGCLEAQGSTVAVLACGPDVDYPKRNAELRGRIVESGGAALTEFPPGSRPSRDIFRSRNRVIAALALMTIVAGARENSGALITARWAADLGREVAAVPGSIRDPFNRGSHQLIQDGAHVVDGAEGALRILGIDPETARVASLDLESLSGDERVVFDALSHRPCHRDELADRCGLSAAALATALTLLAARDLVRALPGGSYVRGV